MNQRRVAAGTIGLLALALLLWLASEVVLIIFAGVLLAVGLTGLSRQLQRRAGISYPAALALLLAGMAVLTSVVAWWRGPPVADEFQRLAQQIPSAARSLYDKLETTAWGSFLIGTVPDVRELQTGGASSVIGRLSGMLSSTFGALGAMLVMVAIGVYGAIESRLYLNAAVHLAPPERRDRASDILLAVRRGLSWWLLGRFSSMAVVGLFTWLGLYVLDVPLAFSLGVIAGLFSFVPNLGPALSVVPALLIASSESGDLMLYVVTLYVGVQTVESYFITPLIQRKAVRLPSAMLLSMQLVFGALFGLLGLVLATPLAVTGIILVQTLYNQDTLGDPVVLLGEHPEARED